MDDGHGAMAPEGVRYVRPAAIAAAMLHIQVLHGHVCGFGLAIPLSRTLIMPA